MPWPRLRAWLEGLESEQLDHLFRFTSLTSLMTTLAALILYGAFRSGDGFDAADGWMLTVVLVSVARIAGARRYHRLRPARDRLHRWAAWAFGTILLQGLLLGSLSLIWLRPAAPEVESLLHIVVATIVIGAAVPLPPFYPVFVAFVVCVMGPLALRDLWIADAYHLTLAALVVATGLYTLQGGRRQAQALAQTQAERRKNAALIEALRLENQRAERAHDAKARFFAAANHDLRQPLHAMGLLAHTLNEDGAAARGDEVPARLVECVDSMAQIVDELLELAQVDVAGVVPRLETFALDALLREVVRTHELQARHKGLTLEIHSSALAVRSDRRLLARVLANLLSNALRYTEHGAVRLVSRVQGDRVEVSVEDSGIGIAGHELPRIFEEFYQVGNPARDRRLGVGLGLATVKRLGELLDLRVQVQSTPGQGSVFRISLPLHDATPTAIAAPAAPHDALLAQRRVLLIEDDADSRAALIGLLRAWGCDVRSAEDVASARQRLTEGFAPEAVLADLRLAGGASGIEAVLAVRSTVGQELPALLVTGDVGDAQAQRAEAAGLRLLAKPVKPMQLRAFLGQAFGS
ncbi:MAG: hybrid sensor histidine kinase/response regulator [Hydrogenophaga sp.]|uniref:hybrid sensor histidine kinase/response regulator n=1 Tax=Hydrogenophaga sp. TaxID=1904254 RepID=UPI0026220CE4|nr:hybrid sensor histidine kinase/response regulator [Hydrogenophaga sp.]MCV0440134.1 hybrid sensor histidine kinase/response regulator [Hydrogenophaga sp.]